MRIRIKNKKRFGIVLSIVLVLIAMISGTYSLFYRENTAQSKESYSTGILNIVAKSKSDNINLTNALPMTDEEGAQTEPYVFNIENVGNLDYNFKIRLLSTSENPINPDYIKLKIDDGEVTTLSSLTNSIIKDNITLKAKETMDVTIRIWLASNTPNTEIGKSFNSKIVTEGQAVYTDVNNKAYINLVQYITNLYNNAEKVVVTANADSERNEMSEYIPTETIEYKYARSVNLMNDRLGGTTASLDGGNIRYYGDNPNNYIDVGDRTSTGDVILWRIIGVFDGKVRIVRGQNIGYYAWDKSASSINNGNGINEWSQADLMKLLNPGYESESINGSLWWNSQSGTCYTGGIRTGLCDFTSSGLSDLVKERIVDQTIYLGAIYNFYVNTIGIYANQAYVGEREDNVVIPGTTCSGNTCNDTVTRTSSWTGKVGLLYISDYGYAADLGLCKEILHSYAASNDCYNNWLNLAPAYGSKWLITPSSADAYDVFYYRNDVNRGSASTGNYVLPVLTLSPEAIIISDGDGSQNNPYVIK